MFKTIRILSKKGIKKNAANDLLEQVLLDCKLFCVKRRFKRNIFKSKAICLYDIETVLEYLMLRIKDNNQAIEIMAYFKVSLENMYKHFGVKYIPFKAIKILIRTTQKANVL